MVDGIDPFLGIGWAFGGLIMGCDGLLMVSIVNYLGFGSPSTHLWELWGFVFSMRFDGAELKIN